MPQEFQELLDYCMRLYGTDNVNYKTFKKPNALEVTIIVDKSIDSPIKSINLSLYREFSKSRSGSAQYFMHIDDFDFEYNSDENKAINEMKLYIAAINENKVMIETKKFLGITLHEKIVISTD